MTSKDRRERRRELLVPRVLSFAIALAVYLAVGQEQMETETIDYDVRVSEIPDGYVLDGELPTVRATLRGTRRALSRLEPDTVQTVEIRNLSPDQRVYRLKASNFALPSNLQVTGIIPSDVPINLVELVPVTFQIQPNVRGTPRSGYEISDISVEPNVVLAQATEGVLNDQPLFTNAIDVTGATETVEVEVGLQVLNPQLQLPRDLRVSVRVEIEPSTAVATFSSIEVLVVGPDDVGYELSHSHVALRLEGTESTMELLRESPPAVSVDVGALLRQGAGRHSVRPTVVGIPEDVTVRTMLPDEILVTVSAPPPPVPEAVDEPQTPAVENDP